MSVYVCAEPISNHATMKTPVLYTDAELGRVEIYTFLHELEYYN